MRQAQRRARGATAIAAALVALLLPASVAAQFENTEVSGLGTPPFLMSKTESRHQDLESAYPGVTYNVYRRQPGDGFRCISANRIDPAGWDRDPAEPPPGEVWWYTVTGDDTYGENRHGSQVPIVEPCACSGPPPLPGEPGLRMRLVAFGFDEPTHLTHAPGDRSRLFVAERPGFIRVIRRGRLLPTPFLDISSEVIEGFERGFYAVAFHPDYANNGKFYVSYTEPPRGNTVISEYQVSAGDPDVADPATRRDVLLQYQPQPIHNNGQVAFSPVDGFLYVGFGDGGPACDPGFTAQDTTNMLGSIVRIDVDGGVPYGIPATNPFVGDMDPNTIDEIFVYGLRNPWRFSFDRLNGDLYIGDVGQGAREEVDYVPVTSPGGENFGWSCAEGSECNTCNKSECSCPASPSYTPPVLEYDHGAGCSLIGGFVYRGCRLPGYHGTYFYHDQCSGFTRSFVLDGGVVTDERDWTADFPEVWNASSFGTDANGELYVVNLSFGNVFRMQPQ